MAVKTKNVLAGDFIGVKALPVAVITALSLTSAVVFSFQPPVDYQVTRVRSFCRTKAGTVTYVVKVGTRSAVATGVFTAATEVGATLSTTLANLKATSSEAITIELTTDGSGVLTNAFVDIEYRPQHMAGEV